MIYDSLIETTSLFHIPIRTLYPKAMSCFVCLPILPCTSICRSVFHLSTVCYLSIWLSLCLFIRWPRWHHHLQTFPTSLSLSPLYCSMKNCFNDIIILSFFLQKSYQFVSISCWVGSSRVNTWASKAIDTLMLSVIIELTLESLACLALVYSR